MLSRELGVLEYFEDMEGSQEMLSGYRFFIAITFDDFGYIIDVVLRRIRILFERMQFCVLRHRTHELLETSLLVILAVLLCFAFLLSLDFPLTFGF